LSITAEFVTSAAGAAGLPRGAAPQVALVGRSNVGKSRLINALARQRLARTSAAAGKTRLVNVYRVRRGSRPPIYLVDLPGYGYARGGANAFDRLVREYFSATGARALLLVDSRHPGLEADRQAWAWLAATVDRAAIVATKIDKLARGERIRGLGQLESVFDAAVLPVSAVTGEGLDDLWNLIDTLTTPPTPNPPRDSPSPSRAATERRPARPATAETPGRRRPRRSSASTSRRSRT
jgi:GTP-binding protein